MPFRFLTVSPRVLRTGKRLVIREPIQIDALRLGGFGQYVLVDADTKQITIKRRSFWQSTTRQLLFDHVRAVTYGYVDLSEPYTSEIFESAHERRRPTTHHSTTHRCRKFLFTVSLSFPYIGRSAPSVIRSRTLPSFHGAEACSPRLTTIST